VGGEEEAAVLDVLSLFFSPLCSFLPRGCPSLGCFSLFYLLSVVFQGWSFICLCKTGKDDSVGFIVAARLLTVSCCGLEQY